MRISVDMGERISGLPKWAQKFIQEMICEIERRDALCDIHAILSDRKKGWFKLDFSRNEVVTLWVLDKDHPHAVASLGPGDVLFVGRARANDGEPT